MNFWEGKRIIVTGGAGFFGGKVVEHLAKKLRQSVIAETRLLVPRKKNWNLVSFPQTSHLMDEYKPDIVIHMAAKCGGIGANRERPGEFFYDNMAMGINVIEACRQANVSKLVLIGTVCAYPKFTPVPFKETSLWDGYPEETNAPYGIAKKSLMVMGEAYRRQYNMNIITLIPVNLYGVGDSLDLANNHVIPALISKFVTARRQKLPFVDVWGTGTASREFLFANDAAEAVVLAAEKYNGADPVNLGSGQEITIKDLVETIGRLTGYEGEIRWDASKPDGQPRRCLDISRAKEYFGWQAKTTIEEGLKKTIAWFEQVA